MSDAKYFQTTKKGEVAEFRDELNSIDRNKVKDAVKKVIAAMTVGKDVSSLFTDIIKQMQTEDIELKKLIYLYIINYARSMPEQSILVVNTFQHDATDPNPLVRGLAIRTLGCVRVDRITEYLSEPLSRALVDKDPYVRKTAAICTAKLYDINAELVIEQGFLGQLRDLVFNDSNPMVVANAVAALTEISDSRHEDLFHINAAALEKLLLALNQCTEWGQVYILDALAKYEPSSEEEAEKILERVSPRLQHANAAVVMSAMRIIMRLISHLHDEDIVKRVVRKLAPPLVTLLSAEPEIQYVTLRNIGLIVQKRPGILQNEVKVFFCKYDDPIYVKMEKLEIVIKLVNSSNIDKVLPEFKEYATEVDVEFVRKSVRAIGRCAIKLPECAEQCVCLLLELIQTKVNYVVQEAIIVIKDIFRKYPNRYERIIADLCENLDTLDEPEAKASMIWIIGEYADRIDNAGELLGQFLDGFLDEHAQVQLQLLTAVVKLFLKRPESAQEMVTTILNLATESSDNPDLRDRGFVYWRLLSSNPDAAKAVVLSQRPPISDDGNQLDGSLLNVLIANLSTLASVYHKPPESFVKGLRSIKLRASGDHAESESDEGSEESDETESEEASEEEEEASPSKTASSAPTPAASFDLLGLDSILSPTPTTSANVSPVAPPASDVVDLFDEMTLPSKPNRNILLSSDKGKGLEISSSYLTDGDNVVLNLHFENKSSQILTKFLFQVNKKNSLGLFASSALSVPQISPGGNADAEVVLSTTGSHDSSSPWQALQMALRTELGDFYFSDTVSASLLFHSDGGLHRDEFLRMWRELSDENEQKFNLPKLFSTNSESIIQRLASNHIFFIANRTVSGKGDVIYCTGKFKGVQILFELTNAAGSGSGSVKSSNPDISSLAVKAVASLLA